MKKTIICLIYFSAIFISGCKPKPIQGQVFVVDQTGTGQALDGIQIIVCDSNQAAAFISQKQAESANQCAAIESNLDALKIKLLAAENDDSNTEAILAASSFTNDSRYIEKMRQCDEDGKQAAIYEAAIIKLKYQYGSDPQAYAYRYPASYYQGWAAERQDAESLREIRQGLINISNWASRFPYEFAEENTRTILNKRNTITELRGSIEDTLSELAAAKSPSFYLSDFQPDAIQIALSDHAGNFEIENQKAGEKIFAKLILPDSKTSYFWLVDLPPEGQKLILSNGNLFVPK